MLVKLPNRFLMEDAVANRRTIERVNSTLSPDGRISADAAALMNEVLLISLERAHKPKVDLAKNVH
jgi:hypothetical protein